MISRTRRGFLKSAAALSGTPFIAELLTAAGPQSVAEPNPDSGQLNVIFHGVFVYMHDENDPKTMTVYGPSVSDHSHVYLAGNWQQEDEHVLLPGVTYELAGTFTEAGSPPSEDETTYPVIKFMNRPDVSKASCTIRVPVPHKIVGLRALRRENVDFFGGKLAPKRLDSLPLAYAYVYRYDATKVRPSLTPKSWIAPHRPGIVNLHIRAERPTIEKGHDGFKAIQDFLGYTNNDISLNSQYNDCVVGPDLLSKVEGILPEEEYFLPELFPNLPANPPGAPQKCAIDNRFQPENCSGMCGIYPKEKPTSR